MITATNYFYLERLPAGQIGLVEQQPDGRIDVGHHGAHGGPKAVDVGAGAGRKPIHAGGDVVQVVQGGGDVSDGDGDAVGQGYAERGGGVGGVGGVGRRRRQVLEDDGDLSRLGRAEEEAVLS